MRMAELSRRSGVPAPTVKYYLREGLLPAGERTQVNQAEYGQEHVRRLRLIRAMIDIGGMSVGSVRDVLKALDEPTPFFDFLATAQDAVTRQAGGAEDEDWRRTRAEVVAYLDGLGWRIRPEAVSIDQLADVMTAWRRASGTDLRPEDRLSVYAQAAGPLAEGEVRTITGLDPSTAAHDAIVGIVLGERALTALRRLAQEDASARIFGESTRKN